MSKWLLNRPLSEQEIERLALNLRHELGVSGILDFNLIPLVENLLQSLIPDFDYIIRPLEEMDKKEAFVEWRLIPFTQVRLYVVAESRWVAPRLSSDCRV